MALAATGVSSTEDLPVRLPQQAPAPSKTTQAQLHVKPHLLPVRADSPTEEYEADEPSVTALPSIKEEQEIEITAIETVLEGGRFLGQEEAESNAKAAEIKANSKLKRRERKKQIKVKVAKHAPQHDTQSNQSFNDQTPTYTSLDVSSNKAERPDTKYATDYQHENRRETWCEN